MNDGCLFGSVEHVLPLVKIFQEFLSEYVIAKLNPNNCVRSTYLDSTGDTDTEFKLGVITLVNGHKAYEVKISGAPFGDVNYMKQCSMLKVNEVVSQIKSMTKKIITSSRAKPFCTTRSMLAK